MPAVCYSPLEAHSPSYVYRIRNADPDNLFVVGIKGLQKYPEFQKPPRGLGRGWSASRASVRIASSGADFSSPTGTWMPSSMPTSRLVDFVTRVFWTSWTFRLSNLWCLELYSVWGRAAKVLHQSLGEPPISKTERALIMKRVEMFRSTFPFSLRSQPVLLILAQYCNAWASDVKVLGLHGRREWNSYWSGLKLEPPTCVLPVQEPFGWNYEPRLVVD